MALNRKQRRNRERQPCGCGSGKQFRHCHGKSGNGPARALRLEKIAPSQIPPDVLHALEMQRAKALGLQAKHGYGRPIVSTEFNDLRVVAVGSEFHYGPKEENKFFPDFLNRYLKGLLTKEWHAQQLATPPTEHHQIWKWYLSMCKYQETLRREADGTFKYIPSGAVHCWYRLAYDLYLIKHNSSLQKTMMERLKDPKRFQGARFELCAAACMVAAGFQIKFEDESDNRSGHPEFVATHESGYSVAVEAKSRHRDGVLGFRGGKASDKVEIEGLLRDALSKKDINRPYFVFVDVNLRVTSQISAGNPWFQELAESAKNLYSEWEAGTFPINSIFFCNDPTHYTPDDVLKDYPFWCYEVPSRQARFALPDPKVLLRVGQATIQRANIPNEFPDR